ncbi:MAG: VTT domain-containing protein [Bacteroidota bacterium]|nr:VTT domain-containing protein [Bacteroidota bacterium]
MWDFLKQLTNPNSIIEFGGLGLLLFVIFAETGLFVGFFLPGDNLILLAGILCKAQPNLLHVNYFGLVFLMTLAAVLGNVFGYWFGRTLGEKLYSKKDSLFFKQKHLEITKTYYAKYGGNTTLIIARFLPIIRTFAPIIAGAIKVDFLKFMFFNIVGALFWILSLSSIGYFLVQMFPQITQHLKFIFIALIILTSIPIIRIFIKNKTKNRI